MHACDRFGKRVHGADRAADDEQIYIVAKAVEPSAHNKLVKAGANNTISPSEIGGQRIATLLMRPLVISFLDVITRGGT